MAVASAAAIAAFVAVRFQPGAPLDVAVMATAPSLRDVSTNSAAGVAQNNSLTRLDGVTEPTITSDAVERALAEAPHERRDLLLSELLARLVRHDAPAAARIAERQEAGYLREVALRAVAQSWTRQDSAAALNWAASLADQDERDAALANSALELAVNLPQLALQTLGLRSTQRFPDSALEGVVQQWATNDFRAACDWTDAQPPGRDRDALLMRLVFARAEQDPADAARIATTLFSDDAQRGEAISTVALRWGARDPMAVREWAFALDAEAQRRVRAELAVLEQMDSRSASTRPSR
jgi:hypothetical protein